VGDEGVGGGANGACDVEVALHRHLRLIPKRGSAVGESGDGGGVIGDGGGDGNRGGCDGDGVGGSVGSV
jgi:hypothetical protein